jgi:hypothetical protein
MANSSIILLSPLQSALWSPLLPPRVSQSQGISYNEQSEGAFSNAFSFAFDVLNRFEFNSDFNSDFAVTAFTRQQSFSYAFSTAFDTLQG